MMRILLASALLASACVVAVAPRRHLEAVTRRAAYDFQCTEEQISIQDIGGNAYAAQGCGRQQIYNCAEASSTCVPESGQPPAGPPSVDPVPPAGAYGSTGPGGATAPRSR